MNSSVRLTFVFLAVTFVCFVSGEYEYTCDVGENNEKVLGNGLCNGGGNGGDGNAKCNDHCQKQFGAEFVESECRTAKGSSKPECICKLKCSVGGCWGDPHCYSFDGTHYGYQGHPEHYLIKPKDGVQFASLPYFTISESNRQWTDTTLGVLEVLTLRVWNQKIEILAPPADGGAVCTLKVNGESKNIPYRYSEIKDRYRENYIDVQYSGEGNSQLVLKTSFGVVIVIIVYPYYDTNYADLAVHVARHPELMGNVCGLFGNFNDNPSDDNIDSKGNPQQLDLFSWDFGDSWRVSDSGSKTSKSSREKIEKDYRDRINKVKNVKGKHEHLQKHCNQLGNPEFVKCGKKQRRVIPSPEDCYTDLSYLKKEKDQESAACELVKAQNKLCGCNVECAR